MSELHAAPVRRSRLLLAFAAVYVIWGSTYLAIHVVLETLPPFTMAGARFVLAGLLLFAWMRHRGQPAPPLRQWRAAALVGALLLLGGHGGVVWAQQRVPSGLAALLVSTVPLWMVLLGWLQGVSPRPTRWVAIGLALGLGGVALLVTSTGAHAERTVDPAGAAALTFAALSWTYGSLRSRRADLPASPFLATAMEMVCGGVLLLVVGLVHGEWARIDVAGVSPRSLFSLVYLVIFGSLIGFSAYIYLLRATTPARATTYAFVNPVVALFLGWLVAGEVLSPQAVGAAAVILAGVVLIVLGGAAGAGARAALSNGVSSMARMGRRPAEESRGEASLDDRERPQL
jgi:drug/metabolite transporter (DMT)-like permease